LSQIIINLLSNALKAIENGGKVSLAVITGTRGVAIEVTDDGHGIAAEDLPHIFERFYKIGGNGLGIGLAIVKELVTAHGWQITAQSRPGKTRFTIETTET
jgi:signal transduction histidine kinase